MRFRRAMEEKPSVAIKGKPGVRGLAERLACVRRMRDMTQAELGKRARLLGQAVSHFECGRRLPSADNLRALCLALDVSADYLLDSH